MNQELMRRFLLRISAALLSFIIGPAGAWYYKQEIGLVIYLIIYISSRTLSAEFSSINQALAIKGYRTSSCFLIAAGMLGFFSKSELGLLFVIPFLLGTYEGLFWVAYHGIRKARDKLLSGKNDVEEAKQRSLRLFQFLEILATVFSALIILALDLNGFNFEIGAIIGGLAAGFALFIPMDEESKSSPISLETMDQSEERFAFGRIIAGSTAIMTLSVTWCMRYFALDSGGVGLLSTFIACAAIIGYLVNQFFKIDYKNLPSFSQPILLTKKLYNRWKDGRTKQNRNIWIWGHVFALLGIIPMIISVLLFDFLFIYCYLIWAAAWQGMLRPMEINIAGSFLGGKDAIGARERWKFRTSSRFLFLCTGWFGIFVLTIGIENLTKDLVLVSGLFLSMIGAVSNIYATPKECAKDGCNKWAVNQGNEESICEDCKMLNMKSAEMVRV